MTANSITIGVTIGDPSGIGPEVVLKALRRFELPRRVRIKIFGDYFALQKNGLKKSSGRFEVIDCNHIRKDQFQFGVLSARFGAASLVYLKRAVASLQKNEIDCLVTGPVSKEAITKTGVVFRGHTEFLAEQFGIKKYAMLFCSHDMRLSLVTRHVALGRVASVISKEKITTTLELTFQFCREQLGIRRPRIAVAALNPHASEGGSIGQEEYKTIVPAIKKFLQKYNRRCAIVGPVPSDSLFVPAQRRTYDVAVCMYHDQGLIPFKMLHFFDGVNVTLGLPFVRTSCDHGTAFSIAGKQQADCRSLLAALALAYQFTKRSIKSR